MHCSELPIIILQYVILIIILHNKLNKLHTSLGALKATKSPYIFCAKACMLASPEHRNSSQAIQNSTFSSLNSDFRNPLNNSNPSEIYKNNITIYVDCIINVREYGRDNQEWSIYRYRQLLSNKTGQRKIEQAQN